VPQLPMPILENVRTSVHSRSSATDK
jgi:hypothetical protein